jgi:hypothetical protein
LCDARLLNAGAANYDVSADGQRFLAIVPPEGEIAAPLTVVQNRIAGLKNQERDTRAKSRRAA